MLQLRPSCEHCDRPLPPDSMDARICSFECTFCSHCVESVLGNVCPNCGGGFCARPIRPAMPWRGKASLMAFPASTVKVHKPVDSVQHAQLRAQLEGRAPERR